MWCTDQDDNWYGTAHHITSVYQVYLDRRRSGLLHQRTSSSWTTMVSAIQCDGAVLPNFSDSVTATSHSGLFSYSSTVSYTCPAGQRFEDGNTEVVVTCAGIGVWDWNPVVTSCLREFVSYTRSMSCVRIGFFVDLFVSGAISKLQMIFHDWTDSTNAKRIITLSSNSNDESKIRDFSVLRLPEYGLL